MNIPSEYTITSEDQLSELAKELLDSNPHSRIWGFYGSMGAGKTTFIRVICQYLEVKENVSSPTFSLVNEYISEKHNESIYHFDFYRIEKEREAVDIGCEEYFDSGNLCLIEWPEKILNLLPHPHLKISIQVTDTKRRISFSYD
jgi:tRNA threonylcarbamoyladenosine biosynthesis protein TsaE